MRDPLLRPTASIFCACRSCSSLWRSRRRSAARSSEHSQRTHDQGAASVVSSRGSRRRRAYRLRRAGVIRLRCQDDNRHIMSGGAHRLDGRQAVAVGETEIEEYRVEAMRPQRAAGARGRPRAAGSPVPTPAHGRQTPRHRRHHRREARGVSGPASIRGVSCGSFYRCMLHACVR